jgi:hypothetical protein
MIKSRKMKWKWRATHLTEIQRSGNMKGRYTCVELGADGWVTLTYIFKREREREGGGGPVSLGTEYGLMMGCCEHGYELQSSVMCSRCGCSSLIFELCHVPNGSIALHCIWSRKFDVHRILIRSMKEYSTTGYYSVVP